MRIDPTQFALANEAPSRQPRCVIRIQFDVASPHLTSHDDISGVPGDVINAVVQRPSAISQKIVPDEGRSEIGSFSFALVDKNSEFTDAMRSQLLDNRAGLRRRKVEFYVGYQGMAFSDFQLFQTQIVSHCQYKGGKYQITCADITRELRNELFRPNFTTLRDSITDTSLEIPVYDTSNLKLIAHGPCYSDAPNTTVGYARIEDEVVRFSSRSPQLLYVDGPTGRGCMNTKAVGHAVDVGTSAEKRTKVEEFIYLEGPGPQIAYAILTGQFYGTSNTLPDNWSLGIDPSFVRAADFTGIGPDLWNQSDESKSVILRFDGLKQQDGKKFLEKEMYLLLGCYSPVYADGTIGLRRMTGVISDASPVVTLTEREIIELSELEHEYTLLHNNFRVEWAWNPITESFERDTGFIDAESMEIHGASQLTGYQFKGLHSSRATDSTLATRLDAVRNRYALPPQTITSKVFGSLNRLEVGDIARIRVSSDVLRDFAGPAGDYNRAFEIQQRTYDWSSGSVTLDLFGSSARPDSIPSTKNPTDRALPDAWYTSEGASLSTVIPIAGNLASPGSYTINGPTTLGVSGAIFYWPSDLTLPNGCNITITGNVQIRIRGFLTLNGTITGLGGGKPGVSDPGTAPWDTVFEGSAGYVGGTRGWDGVKTNGQAGRSPNQFGLTVPVPFTRAANDVFPYLSLQVVDGALIGLPLDLRGTGGGPGGRLVNVALNIDNVGDAGAAGGAGLAIICRGMGFGVSATITLNGADSATTSSVLNVNGIPCYPGCGAPGGPGALLILLDGNNVSIPVITGKVIAMTGAMTQQGNPMSARSQLLSATEFSAGGALGGQPSVPQPPHCGYPDPGVAGQWTWDEDNDRVTVAPVDMSNAAHWIQHIPVPEDIEPDVDTRPTPPTNLAAGPSYSGNFLTWANPDLDSFDVIEVYASLDNNRSNALKVGETRADVFVHRLPLGGLYYYWIRAKLNPVSGRPAVYSEWERVDPTDGESSNIETPGEIPEGPDDFTATGKINGIQFNWSLPWARLFGVIKLLEAAHGADISTAVQIWEGYDVGVLVTKTDTTTRDYWLILGKGGAQSVPEPNGAGLAAAASSVTSALSATSSPPSVSKSATLGTNPRTATTAAASAIASGGTGPYIYAWSWYSGGTGITIVSATSSSTTFTATHDLDGTALFGVARCTVTDAASATTFCDVNVQISFPSIG